MEQQIKKIMEGIISKQGVMGTVAKMYVNDRDKSIDFIKDCGEQIHNEGAKKYWGTELINEIEQFCAMLKQVNVKRKDPV
jgi:hypothetical protein